MKQFIVLVEIDEMTDWLHVRKDNGSQLEFHNRKDADQYITGAYMELNDFLFKLNLQMIDIEEYFVFNVLIFNEDN